MTKKIFVLLLLLSNVLIADDLLLKTDISPSVTAYAQTPITYTIRLYHSGNLTQGTLTQLAVNDPDAIIKKLGDDREYDYVDDACHINRVVEQRYVVIPQQAGELIFSPIVFEGRVLERGDSFFAKTHHTRLSSDELKIEIKPIPAPFHANTWLAAENVQAKQEWSADPQKVQLGESITWTLTLQAKGCLAEQIPDMTLHIPPEFKHYQDKPQIENKLNGNGFEGIKKIKVALIPTKAGTITFPDIKISWWDLQNDKKDETHLPGTTFHIAPAVIADAGDIQTPAQPAKIAPSEPQNLPLWAWVLIGLNSIWVVGGLYYLYKRFYQRKAKTDRVNPAKIIDPKEAEAYLLAWSAQIYPEIKPRNLIELKKQLPESLQAPITELYQALYGHKTPWKPDALWTAFKAFTPKKTSKKKPEEAPLRKLYT